ncbi:MAG: glycosyltransferase family 4 protein [Lachnospiraceae bacterium]|nr:glycosyltransferase family 4 protein [Lachnospiraceae bacterium]
MKKKIAIVNQRYGLDVNGGSEYLTRILAEKLAQRYEVDVITTCAKDYDTWQNYYPPGECVLNGVKVLRFPVEKERNPRMFYWYNRLCLSLPHVTDKMEQKWIDMQGPYAPSGIQYIKKHANDYDVFIFVTYLYYLTAKGLKEVAEKSILIPTAHDEPFLKMKHYKGLFQLPKGYFFNTEEEQELVYQTFGTSHIPSQIGGMGIEVPDEIDTEAFKKKYNLNQYIIYVGRIDYGKNCDELFEYFIRYKKEHPGELKLVLMGKEMMDVPQHEDIISLGFVDEKEKYEGMIAADFLVLPSKYESLSIVVLDSMKLAVPVLVKDTCQVLRAHCEKSGAGFCYNDYQEFELHVNRLLEDKKLCNDMGEKGRAYVDANYQWDVILDKLNALIEL